MSPPPNAGEVLDAINEGLDIATAVTTAAKLLVTLAGSHDAAAAEIEADRARLVRQTLDSLEDSKVNQEKGP